MGIEWTQGWSLQPTQGIQGLAVQTHFFNQSDSTEIDTTVATIHRSLPYLLLFQGNRFKDFLDPYDDMMQILHLFPDSPPPRRQLTVKWLPTVSGMNEK